MTELRTARLTLSPVVEDDAAFVLELLNDPGWIRNIGDRGVRSLQEARAYIRDRFGKTLWLVARDAAGERLGMCGLVQREILDSPDLGYAFLQRHSGQGYATEAAAAVLQHVREVLRLPKLAAIIDPENRASRRVLEKIGFRYVETRDLPDLGASAYFLA
ncbi:GNAT family N-acetyltransferase [Phenylobacterium sp. LjRoot225]|uniref:GNAT family N-acetyltransferase n=1 Tax=Phenylobacterium sp. LjRoot225 TaxID=3342285 RepID=UPI003ECF6515